MGKHRRGSRRQEQKQRRNSLFSAPAETHM
jgi:hypothetical protein